MPIWFFQSSMFNKKVHNLAYFSSKNEICIFKSKSSIGHFVTIMIAAFWTLLFYLERSLASHIKTILIFLEANKCIFRTYYYSFPKFLSVQTKGRKRLFPLLNGHPVDISLTYLRACILKANVPPHTSQKGIRFLHT